MDVCDEFIDVHNVIEELNLLTSLVDQCEKCKFAYLVLNKEDIAKIFIKKLYVFLLVKKIFMRQIFKSLCKNIGAS